MYDKWLEKFSHTFVEYDTGIDMNAFGTFKGKEYHVHRFFKGYKVSALDDMLAEMKRMLWAVIAQDFSTIDTPFEEVIEALQLIAKHGGVDVRYDRLASHYGDGEKAQHMYKRLIAMGYLKATTDFGSVVMSASLTSEARSLLERIE
ncbi:MAG: hypothetical protein GXY50_03780 [Syntrophomonadaceae bacterium]|nr:hypothetical protein [Syntrophomonadaceae bacterium]